MTDNLPSPQATVAYTSTQLSFMRGVSFGGTTHITDVSPGNKDTWIRNGGWVVAERLE